MAYGDRGVASENWERWNSVWSNGDVQSWRLQAATDLHFLWGNHFSDAEVKKLAARGQAAVPVNQLPRVVQQNLAFMLANQPSYAVTPHGFASADKAEVWKAWLKWLWNVQGAKAKAKLAAVYSMAVGVGWGFNYWDRDKDHGKGLPWLRIPHPLSVFVDPSSREPDLSDAEFVIHSQMFDRRRLQRMFPQHKKKLQYVQTDQDSDNPSTGMGSSTMIKSWGETDASNTLQDPLRVIETVYPERGDFIAVVDPATHREYGHFYKKYLGREGTRQMVQFARQNNLILRPYSRTCYHQVVTCGDCVLVEPSVIGGPARPVEMNPFTPLWGQHTGNPFPIGDVRMQRGLNEIADKMWSLTVLTANSGAAPKYMGPKSANAKEEFQRKGAIPGAYLEYDDTDPDTQPPVPIQGLPFPDALATVLQMAIQQIDITSGQFGVAGQGGGGGDRETFRGQMLRDEIASRRPGLKLEDMEEWVGKNARLAMEYTQGNVRDARFIRVADDNGEFQQLFMSPKGAGRDVAQMILGERRFVGDISVGTYDVAVIPGSMKPTNAMAEEARAMELKAAGLYDVTAALRRLRDPEAKGILERMGEIQQLQSQNQAMQEQIKKLKAQVDSEEKMLVRARIDKEVAQEEARLKAVVAQFEAKLSAVLSQLRSNAGFAEKEARATLKDAEKALRLAESIGINNDSREEPTTPGGPA